MCPQYGIYFNRSTVRCPRIGIGVFSNVHKIGLGSKFMSTSMGTLYPPHHTQHTESNYHHHIGVYIFLPHKEALLTHQHSPYIVSSISNGFKPSAIMSFAKFIISFLESPTFTLNIAIIALTSSCSSSTYL